MPETVPRRRQVAMATQVRRTSWLTPSMLRVVVGGGDLSRFAASTDADSYVKIVFISPGVDYPRPLDLGAVRAEFPSEHWPRLRTYTVRQWDPERLELTFDVAVHDGPGLASPWATALTPGSEVLLLGPGGGYTPDPAADWHLLVGDESALPAIAVALERLPAGTPAHVFLEVHGPEDEVELPKAPGATIRWLHRGAEPTGSLLVEAVAALTFPAGAVHAFVHGEAGAVKQLRRLLRIDRSLPASSLSISGYWRLGADDEGWRAAKAQWNREVADSEAALEVPAGQPR